MTDNPQNQPSPFRPLESGSHDGNEENGNDESLGKRPPQTNEPWHSQRTEVASDYPPGQGPSSEQFFLLAVAVEGGLVLLAILLGQWGLSDREQPLQVQEMAAKAWSAVMWGTLGTVPLLGILGLSHWNWGPLRDVNEVARRHLRGPFLRLSIAEILMIALLAGLGEELLFRWCIQGGLTDLIGGPWSLAIGLFVASWLFGLCHWVNSAYGIVTTLIGIYFGIQMVLADSWLAPAISHAAYDFIAILYLTDRLPIRFRG